MIGYCPKCKEYRSDDGSDAWGFYWRNGVPICKRCGHLVDLFNYRDKLKLDKYPVKPVKRIKNSKRCWRCGAIVSPEDLICRFCGARLKSYPRDGKLEKFLRIALEFSRRLAEKIKKKEKERRDGEEEKQVSDYSPSTDHSLET